MSTNNKSVGRGKTNGDSNRSMKKLQVLNYELGILFIVPPPPLSGGITNNLDDMVLPFVTPAPRYGYSDRPATKQAMRDTAMKQHRELENIVEEEEEEFPVEDEVVECSNNIVGGGVEEENEEEVAYGDMLWEQTPICV